MSSPNITSDESLWHRRDAPDLRRARRLVQICGAILVGKRCLAREASRLGWKILQRHREAVGGPIRAERENLLFIGAVGDGSDRYILHKGCLVIVKPGHLLTGRRIPDQKRIVF